MVNSYQVNIGKGGAAGNVVVIVLYVWDWIPVQNVPSFKCSIVPTGPPTAVLLRYEMEGARTRALGSSVGAVP